MSTRQQNKNQNDNTGPSFIAYAIAWILRPLFILAVFAAVGVAGTMYLGAGTSEHTAFTVVLMLVTALWLAR